MASGKTTLLNHILSEDHGKKIAVIENEFGDIAIDDSLVKGKETLSKDSELDARPEDVELTILENGCLCCTVRGDLVIAVGELVDRGGFDHIIIETTGTIEHPVAHLMRKCRQVLMHKVQLPAG